MMIIEFRCFLKGVHLVGVRGQADCGYSRPPSAGVGPEEYGLCAAAQGVQPEVPDALHPRLPKQAGTGPFSSLLWISKSW